MQLTVNYEGNEYNLATNLRVAYKLQEQNNHASYVEVFKKLGDASLEKQIEVVYTAFEVANPTKVFEIKKKDFVDYFLDNYDLSYLLNLINKITEGILGDDLTEKSQEVARNLSTKDNNQGN